ncbi:MAG: LrgB family protein [Rhodobiaceae bacterium]|nr:LrgB family protein [Rhodobiaceae bacterium]MCC0018206.1 LrgB family protein [Rhodobiaceae bacterium]MCC0050802.1 LrgB family protein [Rhodobiaceae bacterium]MCC0060553.1 LrgB family protein [Rhodobiaceae bacterium]
MSVIELWVYLSTSPLLWLTATLGAYVIADRLSQKLNRNPLANPVLIAVLLLMALLKISDTPFPVYFEGAQFVHFMLGPATVALAIPLVENLAEVKRNLVPMLAALAVGSATAVSSAVAIAWALGADNTLIASIAPKSVTTPIAMGISERLGGLPAVTAILVILTGIIGAVIVTPIMNRIGVRDWAARGFAAGVSAHGIGTARAFLVNPVAGTFAGIGMGLNGVITALILGLAVALLS